MDALTPHAHHQDGFVIVQAVCVVIMSAMITAALVVSKACCSCARLSAARLFVVFSPSPARQVLAEHKIIEVDSTLVNMSAAVFGYFGSLMGIAPPIPRHSRSPFSFPSPPPITTPDPNSDHTHL